MSYARKKQRYIFKQYSNLFLKIKKNPKNQQVLKETLKKSNKLYKQVMTPTEGLLDSEFISMHGDCVKNVSNDVSVSLVPFEPRKFVHLLQSQTIKVKEERNKKKGPTAFDVLCSLGTISNEMMSKTPTFQSIYGSFDDSVIAIKAESMEPDTNSSIHAMNENSVTVSNHLDITLKLESSDETLKVEPSDETLKVEPSDTTLEEDSSERSASESIEVEPSLEAKRILNILDALCKRTNDPVCYFEFVVDPDSFSKTIENMFYVSYLVKEGCVALFSDFLQLPVICPTKRTNLYTERRQWCSTILSFTYEDWENVIDKFGLKGNRSVLGR